MNMSTFEVLYTHQKQKKNKTWQDGFLKVSCNGTKANLCDNTGTTLETFHIRANKVFVGSDVETDRYLISIEKAQNNNIDTEMKNIQSAFTQNNATSSNCEKQSVMMRRKPDLYASCKPDLPNPDNFPQVTSNQERTSNTTPSNPTWRPRPNCDDNGNLLERNNIPFFHQKNHSLTTNNTRCSIKTTNDDTMLSMVTNNSTITSLNTGSYRTSSSPSNHQHTIESLSQPYCIAPSSWDHHNIGQHPTMMKEKPPVKRNKTQLLSIFFNKTKKLKSDEKESSHKTTFEISSSSGTTAQARVTNDSETTTQARVTNNSETATQAHVTNGSGTGNWNDRNDSNKSPAINHQNENLSNKKNKMQGSLQTSKLSSLNHDNLFDSFDYGMEDNDTHEFLHDIELLENTKHGDTEIIVVSDEEDSVPYTTDTMIPECSSGTNVSVRDTKVSSSKVPDIREIPCRTHDTKNTPCSTSLNNGKVPYRTEDSRELWLRQPYTIETPYSTSPDTRDTLPFLAPNSLEVPCRLENYRKVPCSTWSDIRISPYQTPTTREVPCSRTPTTHDDILPYQIRTTTELPCRTQDMREVPGRSPENSKIPACLPPNVRELPCSSAQPQSTHWTDVVNPTTRHSRNTIVRNTANKSSMFTEFSFPSRSECSDNIVPKRLVRIPVTFQSALEYKQIFKQAIKEHLNILLYKLSQKYHERLDNVDIDSSPLNISDEKENCQGPSCSHGQAKLHSVKKEGPNKGRFFYSCSLFGDSRCKFFKWADEVTQSCSNGNKRVLLTTLDSIRIYFKNQNIHLYYDCVLERKSVNRYHKNKYTRRGRCDMENDRKNMFIVLKYRENSSFYSKDDIWVISKTINFEPGTTFIGKSLFFGPSSSCELEIEPLSGYSPSNWKSGDTVHAIWLCNASTELSCITNLNEHVTLQHLPILPYILNGSQARSNVRRISTFQTPSIRIIDRNSLGLTIEEIEEQTELTILHYKLNEDQARAIHACTRMFTSDEHISPVTLIHGVFGAGKSFLLAVVVLLLVKLFELASQKCETSTRTDWKILISSTTNVAVDRILLGILELGFDQFVRVGSVRKIAKPILPFSIHNIGSESQELKELQAMLKTDLTAIEKTYVRKSIEKQKLGENRKRLCNVRVVGVTCAACTFPLMEKMKFPVLLLDECSQMTEPSSLLPIARFACRKLVLVGDPKQLNPTMQGSGADHDAGLEQTLFDRFIKMDVQPIILRTQYRCHPYISSIANKLFYNNLLLDGVTTEQRQPLVDFLPTLCFYDVPKGREERTQDGSHFNKNEAMFVVYVIKSLLASDVEPSQIGVITQYKSQLTTITNLLLSDESSSHKELKGIQISTVDAFQGGEKDVILLSCVRTQHVGFIDCKRRTNVALTRAKRHLCVVGCGKMLSKNTLWGQVINICQENDGGLQSCEQFMKNWNKIEQLVPPKEISLN